MRPVVATKSGSGRGGRAVVPAPDSSSRPDSTARPAAARTAASSAGAVAACLRM